MLRFGISTTSARTSEKWDLTLTAKTHSVRAFRKDTFREPLDRVVTTLQDSAKRLERIGDYRLEEIEIRLGVSAGRVVVTLEGGISLRYKRTK